MFNRTEISENLKRENQQIDFVLAKPLHPLSKIYLDFWPAHELEARKEANNRQLEALKV